MANDPDKSNPGAALLLLPQELQCDIFDYLSNADLTSLSSCNRRLRTHLSSSVFQHASVDLRCVHDADNRIKDATQIMDAITIVTELLNGNSLHEGAMKLVQTLRLQTGTAFLRLYSRKTGSGTLAEVIDMFPNLTRFELEFDLHEGLIGDADSITNHTCTMRFFRHVGALTRRNEIVFSAKLHSFNGSSCEQISHLSNVQELSFGDRMTYFNSRGTEYIAQILLKYSVQLTRLDFGYSGQICLDDLLDGLYHPDPLPSLVSLRAYTSHLIKRNNVGKLANLKALAIKDNLKYPGAPLLPFMVGIWNGLLGCGVRLKRIGYEQDHPYDNVWGGLLSYMKGLDSPEVVEEIDIRCDWSYLSQLRGDWSYPSELRSVVVDLYENVLPRYKHARGYKELQNQIKRFVYHIA